ncbi:MAG: hypothetical protein ISR96_09465 [Nitrospira sp.]|nr:hypothetical protein [Nitrospira sp.]
MRNITQLCLIFCCILIFTACSYKEGIVQSSSESYLHFTGNTENVLITIDMADPLPIASASESGKPIHYQVSPGKHKIKVTRDNIIIVNREILIGEGMTKEINIK